MRKDKDIKDIRPAKGAVKIGSKKKEGQKVIQGPEASPPPIDSSSYEPPSEQAMFAIGQLNNAKERFANLMKEFNSMLSNKTLQKNKSKVEVDIEKNVINGLIKCAIDIESLSPGEGIIGLCTLNLRQGLLLRDACNEMAHQMHIIKMANPDLAKKEEEEREKEARIKILKEAEKLGLKSKIKFE